MQIKEASYVLRIRHLERLAKARYKKLASDPSVNRAWAYRAALRYVRICRVHDGCAMAEITPFKS